METNKDWLEELLRKFEEKANKILGAYKGRIDEILYYNGENPSQYPEKAKAAKQILNCRKILQCCNRLRTSVRQNNPHRIVYNTAWLSWYSYNAGLLKTVNSILGRFRGGKREKKGPAFKLLVRYAWQYSRRKTCLSMWKFLTRKLEILERSIKNTGERKIIEGCDFVYEKKTNKITLYFEDEKKRPKEMGFRSFQRYVRDFKEELKKDSQ